MPSAFLPWHEEQPTRKSSRPLATRAASSVTSSEAPAEPATRAAAPPVTRRPSSITRTPAYRLRRWADTRWVVRWRSPRGDRGVRRRTSFFLVLALGPALAVGWGPIPELAGDGYWMR